MNLLRVKLYDEQNQIKMELNKTLKSKINFNSTSIRLHRDELST